MTGRLYREPGGHLVETLDPGSDPVLYSDQGGGFEMSLPNRVFHHWFKPAEDVVNKGFRPVMVSADWCTSWSGVRKLYPAYCNELRWNGWAIPYFDLAVAFDVARDSGGVVVPQHTNVGEAWFSLEVPEDDRVKISAETISVDGEEHRAYQIADGWCWEIW